MRHYFNCWLSAALVTALGTTSLGQISGAVKLDGPPPVMKPIDMSGNPKCAAMHKGPLFDESVVVGEKGALANVLIFIVPPDRKAFKGVAVPKAPATLTQKGCVYHPHILACMVGQDVVIKCEDEFLHNVHGLCSINNPFNFAQTKVAEEPAPEKTMNFRMPEQFLIKSDIHPWMKAWVFVLDHPYFAVTGSDGKYSINTAGLKDGDYTLDVWQETYGVIRANITVKNGTAISDFTFKSDEK